MLLTLLLFWRLLPAYSVPGRKLQDEIDGLRQYSASPRPTRSGA